LLHAPFAAYFVYYFVLPALSFRYQLQQEYRGYEHDENKKADEKAFDEHPVPVPEGHNFCLHIFCFRVVVI
jgi:hypothetical protein